ncbi:WXG100 family type VII secretion target [Amycolatopsis nigrescens]|uniref:WXG100 family type VII secretion target n=1 Tax=Amycolatopsis nigrescens TaxID=381445 RepID=UPI00035E94CD|nr:type VII secretion target [Amycolatopsis nigrescens]
MTAPNQFQAEPGEIRKHAGTVGGLAAQLSSAAGVLPGELPDNALGSFVGFLTAGLTEAMAKTTESITHASSAVHDLSTGLGRAADAYQQVEDQHTTRLRVEGAQ